MLIFIQICFVILLVDFASGLAHWFEDAYVGVDTPLIGPSVGRLNIIHHHLPRHMVHKTYWQTSWDLIIVAVLLVSIAWLCGMLTWQVCLFAAIGANANEFHKWAHRTRRENGRIVTTLQLLGLVQTPRHHMGHHVNPKTARYCTITNFLNPVLDRIRFWDGLEWLLAGIGLHRLADTSVTGPTPDWIKTYQRMHEALRRTERGTICKSL